MTDSTTEREPGSLGCGPLWQIADDSRSLRQQVFETVRAAGRIPRIELARSLGISPASVTATSSELIASGLIEEVAAGPRVGDFARGRPPVALGVRGSALYVAGIKMSDLAHSAVIVDFAGDLVASARMERDGGALALSDLLREAEQVLDNALRAANLSRAQISSVGLGIPGIVDNEAGTVFWSPLLHERELMMRDAFAAIVGVPVEIDNDANLVTLAELWFGAGRKRREFVVVTIEQGVGMGLVLNHQLYRGAKGLGMELGHTIVQLDGALCRCGKRGCLEAYVADYALVREARTALNLGNRGVKSPQILLESLYDHAKAGNQAARAIFGRAGRFLALGLANVVNIFDPSLVLLSGERMRYDYLYAEEVLSEMQHMILQKGRPAPTVEIRAWGDLLWARGAAALALDATTRATFNAEPEAA